MPMIQCLGCRRLFPERDTTWGRCAECAAPLVAAREARRGKTAARGLGSAHRRATAALRRAESVCERCGESGTPENPLTGEHGVPRAHGGTEVTAILCLRCNGELGGSVRRRP